MLTKNFMFDFWLCASVQKLTEDSPAGPCLLYSRAGGARSVLVWLGGRRVPLGGLDQQGRTAVIFLQTCAQAEVKHEVLGMLGIISIEVQTTNKSNHQDVLDALLEKYAIHIRYLQG